MTVTLTFASPGTGSSLKREAVFGIYLIDQMHLHQLPLVENTETLIETTPLLIAVTTLRKLFHVKPASGLPLHTQFKIQSTPVSHLSKPIFASP